jgi:hypothetical protein
LNVNFSRVISRPVHIQQVPTTDHLTEYHKTAKRRVPAYDRIEAWNGGARYLIDGRTHVKMETFWRQDGPGYYAFVRADLLVPIQECAP